MAIHVRHLEELERLARAVLAPASSAGDERGRCERCADLGAAVLRLTHEVEQLREPYARAFRDGASGALDYAARTFDAIGDEGSASILRRIRTVVEK